MPDKNREERRRQRAIVALMLDDSPHAKSAMVDHIWNHLQSVVAYGTEADKHQLKAALDSWVILNKE